MSDTNQAAPQSKPETKPETGPGAQADKPNYKKTVNLPKTGFPMKANLVQNEPASLKRWNKLGLYAKLREQGKSKPRWVFHDGPPYANGSLHLGHILNKSLKDFVVRHRTMAGFDVPYVPGWDCHGLPIEHRVVADLVESGKIAKLNELPDDKRRVAIRRDCAKYAESQVKLQSKQMQRLLTVADYDEPYLTMKPWFEARVLETLAELVEQGLVTRSLKPVHWSVANETALAEAELEYMDREDLSVYVDFEADDADAVYAAFGLDDDTREEQSLHARPSFMIWTTTPWTLPANLAIAVNPEFDYALVRTDGNVTVMATDLVERVTKAAKAEDIDIVARTKGDKLLGLRYRHAFRDSPPEIDGDTSRAYSVVGAEYVTLDDGTGLVHTAPGHGQEDFETGKREGLPVYCPVRHDGTYDDTVPEWIAGQSIWKANDAIHDHLRDSGHLFYSHRFDHSYPHDWRSKTPVIFRCTEQWFVRVDEPAKRNDTSLRAAALGFTDESRDGSVGFIPQWGRNRFRSMIENRPDWCISRQRSWGVGIPAFTLPDGSSIMTAAIVRAVAAVVADKGSSAWWELSPAELLAAYDPAADPDAPSDLDIASLRKGHDILDVWFESGASWNAACRARFGDDAFPTEVYLEGSDQHRGWFQSSMLLALGHMGEPPYKRVLTHGFMVDKDGKKLSKSSGDSVDDLFQKYGADVVRWWVSSLSYEGDMKTDSEFFKLAGESYRKVRNTLRFMLSNLDDFDASTLDEISFAPTSIEAWVLGECDRISHDVRAAMDDFDFQRAHKMLYNFCNDTLSSIYLAAIKDRLYCDAADSERRRSAQAALYRVTDVLCRLLAPLLPHTADEAYRDLVKADKQDAATCVHLLDYAEPSGVTPDAAWPAVMQPRDEALAALERVRADSDLDNPLDAGVTMPDPDGVLAKFDATDFADLLGVSRFAIGDAVRIDDLRAEPRCERSWKRDPTVRERSDGGMLSDRDAAAIGVA
ncbi:MAG: isoleucine--tRNA ligase [Planctomycetota bacterium]